MINQILIEIILAVLFLVFSYFSFTVVGKALVSIFKIQLEDFFESLVLGTTLGFASFTFAAYILAFLHLRFFMLIFPILGLLLFLKGKFNLFSLAKNIEPNLKKFFIVIFIFGVAGQLAVNAPSGLTYQNGVYFWSSHGHDGVWHLSLMEELKKNTFPFQNPGFAGNSLQNYHFFVDLFMSEVSRLFFFSNLDVYFRFVPLLFSILMGLSSFILLIAWTKKV